VMSKAIFASFMPAVGSSSAAHAGAPITGAAKTTAAPSSSASATFHAIFALVSMDPSSSVALRQVQDVLADVVERHLLRDGRDLVEPLLAAGPREVELVGVAVAPVGLRRHVARLEARLGGHQLGGVGLRPARLAVIEEPGGLQAHQLGGLQ